MRQASWCDPAGGRPVQVRGSARLVMGGITIANPFFFFERRDGLPSVPPPTLGKRSRRLGRLWTRRYTARVTTALALHASSHTVAGMASAVWKRRSRGRSQQAGHDQAVRTKAARELSRAACAMNCRHVSILLITYANNNQVRGQVPSEVRTCPLRQLQAMLPYLPPEQSAAFQLR